MPDLRALSTVQRPAMLATHRPVVTPPGSFAPLPNRTPAGLVLAIHPIDRGPHETAHVAACRAYLSAGLAAPDGILGPLGWLLDIVA